MLPVHFAPLQGYTDDAFRRIHHRLVGGVSHYYTPFIRMEAGSVRAKDARDMAPQHNRGVPVVPQIIMKSVKEFEYLTHIVEENGYTHIDINMGCPFPLQAKHGRGSGLLSHPDIIGEIAEGISKRSHLTFSVKMRLGWEDKDEWRTVLPILNQLNLSHITLHPRIGAQQYKGEVDMQAFSDFYDECRHPLVYNGDLHTVDDMHDIEKRFPRLAGLMMGRGLLARPWIAAQYSTGHEPSATEKQTLLMEMHRLLMEHWQPLMNSDAQLHAKLRLMWEYMEEELGRKAYKKIMKSGNLKNYLGAVRGVVLSE